MQTSTNSGPEGGRLSLGGSCARARLRPPGPPQPDASSARRAISFGLRGLEALTPPIRVPVGELGEVVLNCPMWLDPATRDLVTGRLLVLPPADVRAAQGADTAWCDRAIEAGEDVLIALSAAVGVSLAARIIQTWPGDGTKTIDVRETATVPQGRDGNSLRIVPDLALKAFLNASAAATADGTLKALRMALQWLAVPTLHSELRLFCAATAIENMILDGLTTAEKCKLPEEKFRPARRAAKETLRQALPNLEPAEINSLLPRNDADLQTKIERLLRKWGAPTDQLPEGALRNAVNARNHITHRGINSVLAASGRVEVWPHAMVFREVAFRLVFARLRYEGPYVSFVGRRHERHFPSCKPINNSLSE